MAAVGEELISAVVGYSIKPGNNSNVTSNLPQRVSVICEANHDNQTGLNPASPSNYEPEWQATSLKAVGAKYGYGSPAYLTARILFKTLGGIPIVFYPQKEASGATAKVLTIEATGTATENATHYVVIAGRDGLDGQFYAFTVNTGDTAATIHGKIEDTVNAVLGSPMSASSSSYSAVLTSKWRGLTADGLSARIDTNGKSAGMSYSVSSTQSGAGTPSISDAITAFGSKWNTILVNTYGTVDSIMDALEEYNGIPDTDSPTGQYRGIVMRPLIAFTGSVEEDPSSITDDRKDQVTIAICPAPLSEGLPMEAAANMAAIYAPMAQNTPELDPINKSYIDMPTPELIGAMADYTERDRIVKKGCSTVSISNGKYKVEDFVTTYHPEGVLVPSFRYVRDLTVMFNIRYGYYILEQTYVVGAVIANDNDTVNSSKVIKPKTWKQVISSYFNKLVGRGLIVNADAAAATLSVSISNSNQNRLNTSFKTTLTGIARISSTESEVLFNFGS